MCLKCGWAPRFDKDKLKTIVQKKNKLSNYPGFYLFPDTTNKEIQKMHDNNVIKSCKSLAIYPLLIHYQ